MRGVREREARAVGWMGEGLEDGEATAAEARILAGYALMALWAAERVEAVVAEEVAEAAGQAVIGRQELVEAGLVVQAAALEAG